MSNDGDSSHAEEEEDIANLFDVVISDPSPADKRAHHNALERKRRDLIKDSFHSLLVCVPNITDSKASRAQILKKATNYIALMKDKIGKFQEDISSMKDQHKTLEQQVIALEKIKATSTFAQSSGFIKPDSISPEPTGSQKRKGVSADAAAVDESPIKKRLRRST